MDLFLLLFLVFSFIILFSAIMVVSTRNPIHSILFLILVFVGSSGILLMVGVEFLALMFIVVYVGAIAVLFLFVIMMLNVKIIELNENLIRYLPISGLISFIFIIEFFILLDSNSLFDLTYYVDYINWVNELNSLSNMELIGQLLYTYYFSLFIIVGLILLIAMIGPIVLTLNKIKIVRRQDIYEQVLRNPEKTVVLKDNLV